MLYYKRIDLFEGIDPAKSNNCKECIVSLYRFVNLEFKFQTSVCNGCHNLTTLLISLLKVMIICAFFMALPNLTYSFIRKFCA